MILIENASICPAQLSVTPSCVTSHEMMGENDVAFQLEVKNLRLYKLCNFNWAFQGRLNDEKDLERKYTCILKVFTGISLL